MGYDLPVAEEEGEEEPEFDAILAIVDPNKDGSVQLRVIKSEGKKTRHVEKLANNKKSTFFV